MFERERSANLLHFLKLNEEVGTESSMDISRRTHRREEDYTARTKQRSRNGSAAGTSALFLRACLPSVLCYLAY